MNPTDTVKEARAVIKLAETYCNVMPYPEWKEKLYGLSHDAKIAVMRDAVHEAL